MIILVLDALDLHQVKKFNCKNLMQKEYGQTDLSDFIGHLTFGIAERMARVYHELDKMAEQVKDLDDFIFIISDNGMKAVGKYGDYSRNGFYSSNRRLGLNLPKILVSTN